MTLSSKGWSKTKNMKIQRLSVEYLTRIINSQLVWDRWTKVSYSKILKKYKLLKLTLIKYRNLSEGLLLIDLLVLLFKDLNNRAYIKNNRICLINLGCLEMVKYRVRWVAMIPMLLNYPRLMLRNLLLVISIVLNRLL